MLINVQRIRPDIEGLPSDLEDTVDRLDIKAHSTGTSTTTSTSDMRSKANALNCPSEYIQPRLELPTLRKLVAGVGLGSSSIPIMDQIAVPSERELREGTGDISQ